MFSYFLQGYYTNLHSHQQHLRVTFSPYHGKPLYFSFSFCFFIYFFVSLIIAILTLIRCYKEFQAWAHLNSGFFLVKDPLLAPIHTPVIVVYIRGDVTLGILCRTTGLSAFQTVRLFMKKINGLFSYLKYFLY
jgi:hypothetical protein